MNSIDAFSVLFVNRNDVYTVQQRDGQYFPEKDTVSEKVISDHIEGNKTVGLYQLNKSNNVKWLCFDFDGSSLKEQFKLASDFYLKLRNMGISSVLLEFSGMKGYHVWIFCNEIDGISARYFAENIAKGCGVHEIFPKQIEITVDRPYGNLVKMPLGIHRKSEKRSTIFIHTIDAEERPYWKELDFETSLKYLEQLADQPKYQIPKAVVKEVQKKIILQPSKEKGEIPQYLLELINSGVSEGERHLNVFVIVKELHNLGYTDDKEILNYALEFNKNCRPPKEEKIVENHVKNLLEKSDKYLVKEISEEELKKLKYGEIEEELEKEILEQNTKLPVIWLKDIKNMVIPEQKWLIKGILPEEAMVILAGARSSFKSWVALHSAVCIANGKRFLGEYDTQKAVVLYIDEENGLGELKRRLDFFKNAENYEEEGQIAFLSLENIKLTDKFQRESLDHFLEEYKPKLIIVDSFNKVFSTKDENSASELTPIFTNIVKPAIKKYGLTWLFLHHVRKGSSKATSDVMDEIRGTSELVNYAETVLVARRIKSTTRFNLITAKMRRAKETDPMMVNANINDEKRSAILEYKGTAIEAIEAEELCGRDILKWLMEEDVNSFKTSEIMVVMKPLEYTRPTVYRALANLKTAGKLSQPKKGVYERTDITFDSMDDVSKSPKSPETIETINKQNNNVSKSQAIEARTCETENDGIGSLERLNTTSTETCETSEKEGKSEQK